MSVCDQDHGGVAVPIAGPFAGGFLEPLDLLFGQILPGPKLGIRGSAGNCPVCDAWEGGLSGGFSHANSILPCSHCLLSGHYTDSLQVLIQTPFPIRILSAGGDFKFCDPPSKY